jgi:hypothetical protein
MPDDAHYLQRGIDSYNAAQRGDNPFSNYRLALDYFSRINPGAISPDDAEILDVMKKAATLKIENMPHNPIFLFMGPQINC